MGQSSIKDALARKKIQNPQYDYMWRVELPDLTEIPPESLLEDNGTFIDNILDVIASIFTSKEDINHRVSGFDSPFFQMDTKKITNRNSFWYSASNNDIGSITMTMDEFEDGMTYDYLNKWKNLIINDNGTYNPPYLYKRDIKFIRMSATNLDLHIFRYKGFFVNEVSSIQNNYDGNDIIQYSVILTGDSMEYESIPASEVKSKVAMAEAGVLLQNWANDEFKVDGMSGAEKAKILGNLSDLFY